MTDIGDASSLYDVGVHFNEEHAELMLLGLTFEEDMYERPCIVDDSKNSLKISIFTLAVR